MAQGATLPVPTAGLRVRELPRAEIEAILSRNHVGRIAFVLRDWVEFEPVQYVYDAGCIYGRMLAGNLGLGRRNAVVALAVDEVDDVSDWRSIIVRGRFQPLTAPVTEEEREEWRRGLSLLRALAPETLTEQDPLSDHAVVFRVAIETASGRAASMVPVE